MFETLQVLVIVHSNDIEHYENLQRIHSGDCRVRVILDRRRDLPAHHPVGAPTEPEARERRSRSAQHWQDGHLVIETGYS